MNVLCIDPYLKTITEHVLFADTFYAEALQCLSADDWTVHGLQALQIGDNQYLLVTEAAGAKLQSLTVPTFQWGGVPEWTVIGKALVVDMRDGDFVGTSLSREYVAKLVKWEEPLAEKA